MIATPGPTPIDRGEASLPAGCVRLARSGPEPGTRVGCLLLLAGVLTLAGLGILAAFFVNPSGKGDMWVMPLVGGAFAAVGALLLYGGLRGARGLRIPATELYLETNGPLMPGTTTRLWICQPGPVDIESLRVQISCDRVYQRQVRPDSSATVEDHETLWQETLLDVRNQHAADGARLEHEAVLSVPPDAQPSGPASPDGRIRWRLEVWGETGVLSAIYHAFDVSVGAAVGTRVDATMSARPDATGRDMPSAAGDRKGGVSMNSGCLFMGAGFLLTGVFFLWAFFSGAASAGRGNPYMALVGGAMFAGFGLLVLAVTWMSMMAGRPAAKVRRRHPRSAEDSRSQDPDREVGR